MTGRKDSYSLSPLKWSLVGVCLIAFAAGAGAVVVHKCLVFVVEQVGQNQSVWVNTRLSFFPTINIGAGPVTLMAFIFPDSKFDEEIDVDWYSEPPQMRTQLTAVRFTTTESLAKVADWYSHKLGGEFSKMEGWTEPSDNDQDRWRSRVEKTANPAALVFRQSLGQRVRGVLLKTSSELRVTDITLYDSQR